MKIKFEWESLGDDTARAKVFGGWVLNTWGYNDDYNPTTESMVFIPDLNHSWEAVIKEPSDE